MPPNGFLLLRANWDHQSGPRGTAVPATQAPRIAAGAPSIEEGPGMSQAVATV